MQPEGPYRFTHALGGSPVGKAWAAIDEQGRFVTVAVLDATVAAAPGWRESFAGVADSLAQAPGGPAYTYADFSADAPWVAYPAEAGAGAEKLFRALGVEYTPAPTAAPPTSAPPSVSAPPVSSPPQPVSAVPQAPWAVQTGPVPGKLVSAIPHPISGVPISPAEVTSAPPAPVMSAPPAPVNSAPPDTYSHGPTNADLFASPVRRITPSAPPKRRTGLWVGAAALVLVVLAGGGGLVAWAGRADDDNPADLNAAATATATATAESPPMPTAPPQSPGIEPPHGGKWPAQWPGFTERDNVRTLTGLEGLGFPVKVPMDWSCTLAGQAEGFVKYNCGMTASGGSPIGGELIVRNCPEPCDEQRQTTMRMSEEAWGARWIRSGQYATYAEALINADGEQRHALVVVAYFRSGDGVVDRQLVLRMTSPVPEAQQLRRVATYLRDVVVF
ncbi:hypothetical protein [Micromonospora sp. NPDC005197]|uniref:hypothetical protein n=1 Tax=Micromonospora sp. NPDC005197 TaxID=3157020 RepID=UPI00339DFC7E